MLQNSLLLSTLHAVEQVEISFEQTLRTIGEINHRYEVVSSLKQRGAKGQDTYEREIQAAITEPTYTKIFTKKWKRKKATPVKRVQKRSTISASSLQHCGEEAAADPEDTPAAPAQRPEPFMCLQTNCQFYHIECQSNIRGPTKTYKQRIERLHRAAQQQLDKQCKSFSNACGNPQIEQQDEDDNCATCCSYCCGSCCCKC
ncbi:uncharacterized protein LOC117582371 [Drosophila guanche]|uniref:Uncharacterized protein n=1 Tax=Drosophila guanche TaxID=7266 RepID=A0A3B0JC31_DROGU|nr:uncharacterized protein LOC117582371 [Drosophila guanche]SPP79937.1 Hypothetical predicted protein [Drosophila guanche]